MYLRFFNFMSSSDQLPQWVIHAWDSFSVACFVFKRKKSVFPYYSWLLHFKVSESFVSFLSPSKIHKVLLVPNERYPFIASCVFPMMLLVFVFVAAGFFSLYFNFFSSANDCKYSTWRLFLESMFNVHHRYYSNVT